MIGDSVLYDAAGALADRGFEVLDLIGRDRVLAMVTPHNGVVGSDSAVIRSAARVHRGRIIVLDWDRLSAGHGDWFAPDGIHLGGPVGIDAYAGLVASTLPFAVVACPDMTSSPRRSSVVSP